MHELNGDADADESRCTDASLPPPATMLIVDAEGRYTEAIIPTPKVFAAPPRILRVSAFRITLREGAVPPSAPAH